MNEEETSETKVLVNGKLITLEELKQKYTNIIVGETPSNVRVMDTLATADKPLSRRDIAQKIKLTRGYTRNVLKRLIKKGLVMEFRMGGRTLYYLLTEKGFNFYRKLKSENR